MPPVSRLLSASRIRSASRLLLRRGGIGLQLYKRDAKKSTDFIYTGTRYRFSGFSGLIKPISGLRPFSCFSALIGLKPNFGVTDMNFSGLRLKRLSI